MFGLERDDVTEGRWSLNDEKLLDLHCSNIYRIKMKVLDEACSTYELQVIRI